MFIMESKESYHAVKNAPYSIDWTHKIAGLEVPSQHPIVLAVKESSARIYGQPVIKKEPITPVMLNDLVSRYFRIHHPSLQVPCQNSGLMPDCLCRFSEIR